MKNSDENIHEERSQESVSRRNFLTQSIEVVSVAAFGLPLAVTVLSGCAAQDSSSNENGDSDGGIPTNSSNHYTLKFTDYPNLNTVGVSISVTIHAASGTKRLHITQVSSGTYTAVSTICTHQGCTVGTFSTGSQSFDCPCHGSVFNSTGAVLTGPATQPLPSYACTVESDGVDVLVP